MILQHLCSIPLVAGCYSHPVSNFSLFYYSWILCSCYFLPLMHNLLKKLQWITVHLVYSSYYLSCHVTTHHNWSLIVLVSGTRVELQSQSMLHYRPSAILCHNSTQRVLLCHQLIGYFGHAHYNLLKNKLVTFILCSTLKSLYWPVTIISIIAMHAMLSCILTVLQINYVAVYQLWLSGLLPLQQLFCLTAFLIFASYVHNNLNNVLLVKPVIEPLIKFLLLLRFIWMCLLVNIVLLLCIHVLWNYYRFTFWV